MRGGKTMATWEDKLLGAIQKWKDGNQLGYTEQGARDAAGISAHLLLVLCEETARRREAAERTNALLESICRKIGAEVPAPAEKEHLPHI